MRCFNHPDVEAVGSCKSCCKGLCAGCATDLGHGLACESHIDAVENLNLLIERNVRVGNINKRGKLITPLFLGFMGILFLFSGVISGTHTTTFGIVMGIGFVIFAVVTLLVNRMAWNQ
ncbi:MAG: hypothetical protein R2747_08690 [Pyrinomonadaceae bacterium]